MHGPLEAVAAAVAARAISKATWPRLTLEGEEPRALEAMVDWIGSTRATELRSILADTVLSDQLASCHSRLAPRRPASSRRPTRSRPARLGWSWIAWPGRWARGALYVDNSPAGGEVFACKAIVPGLEVETMSYHRIGEPVGPASSWPEGSPLVGLGGPPDGLLADRSWTEGALGAARRAGLARPERRSPRPSARSIPSTASRAATRRRSPGRDGSPTTATALETEATKRCASASSRGASSRRSPA